MNSDRRSAIAAGEMFYDTGKACKRGHVAPRYASSGICRECQREANEVQTEQKARGKKAIMSEQEVHALLLRGGPMSRSMAEAAGLKWFNHPQGNLTPWTEGRGVCHGIIGLDGFCPLCGEPTPEPVDVKAQLELAERLLS